MRLDILLEPPGLEADSVMKEWLVAIGLQLAVDGMVEIRPDQCLDALVELRNLCYERELTVNVKFYGKED